MGLIRMVLGAASAAAGSVGGVLADQWKEYFYCESLTADVLVAKGEKRASKRSANTKGSDNIISNGSIIAVADGQCMMIVEQGKVVEFCAEPGEFTYDTSTEPSIFTGSLGQGLLQTFAEIGKRFTFGGEAPKDQRVYYFNTKEIVGNKYGTPSPVPFRVVDQRAGLDVDISIKCFGEYSYKIVNPMLFYANVCGNVTDRYERGEIDSQLKTELLTQLQPAFARLSEQGIRYSALPGHTTELSQALKDLLSRQWTETRGIEIGTFGVSSVKADEEDERMIKEMQRNAAFLDPARGAAQIVGAQADAMREAAKNQGGMGAMGGFVGMNTAGADGGVNAQNLYAMGQQQPQAPAADGWRCECGAVNTGKFCSECGKPKPAPADSWTCACGAVNTGKFCSECGKPRPAAKSYKCSRCGWVPEDPANPPKFCPECGKPLDDSDLI